MSELSLSYLSFEEVPPVLSILDSLGFVELDFDFNCSSINSGSNLSDPISDI